MDSIGILKNLIILTLEFAWNSPTDKKLFWNCSWKFSGPEFMIIKIMVNKKGKVIPVTGRGGP
jgi:hypothetical protein